MGAFTINYGQIVESVVTECIVSNVDAEDGSKQNNGVRCLAIWDSGATSSIITRNIIDKLKRVHLLYRPNGSWRDDIQNT